MQEAGRRGAPYDWILLGVLVLIGVGGGVWVLASYLSVVKPWPAHDPFVTRQTDLHVSPVPADSSRFAYVVETRRLRFGLPNPFWSTWPSKWVSGRMEVYVYDLGLRRGPTLVTAWDHPGPGWYGVAQAFDGSELVVATSNDLVVRHDTVTIATGERRSSGAPAPGGSRLPYDRGRSPDTSRLHVLEEHGRFYLRGPAPRYDEFLFEHVVALDGDRSSVDPESIEGERRTRAHRTAQQQIVSVKAQDVASGLRVEVGTWAPRPDSLARRYRATFTLAMPIVLGGGDPTGNDVQLLVREVTLGPRDHGFVQVFSEAELARSLPDRMRREREGEPWHTALGVRLVLLDASGSPDPDGVLSGASDGVTLPTRESPR